MTLKEELLFLSPEPIMVGGEAIFSLTVRQVLGFLALPQDPKVLEKFLKENHKEVTTELIQLYEASSYLLQIESEDKTPAKEEKKEIFKNPQKEILLTSLIHVVSQEFKMGWQEILDMWISHFHLALLHIKNIREREMEEINKRKKSK